MTLNVCPADTVRAPVERVWELLMHPAGYGRFWEFTVERVELIVTYPTSCTLGAPPMGTICFR